LSKCKLTDKKAQVNEPLLQFQKKKVGLRTFTGAIKKEKRKKGEVGNQITGNRTTTSLERKRGENTSLLANSA